METFTINGKEYKAKAFDFNLVCDLEDMGVQIGEAGNKPMSMVRAYISLCIGKGKEFSGREIEQHIIGGGQFDEIMDVMSAEMDKSDFFQALRKKEQENQGTDPA